MNDLELLLHQTRHVHAGLTAATADMDAAQARLRLGAGGERPSAAWLLGHLLLEAEATAEAVAGLTRTQAEGALSEDWDVLRATWRTRSAACLAALEGVAPADLDLPPRVALHPDFEASITDRRRFWSGHVFHMTYHLGQLGSLRAELGLGWWRA